MAPFIWTGRVVPLQSPLRWLVKGGDDNYHIYGSCFEEEINESCSFYRLSCIDHSNSTIAGKSDVENII